MVVLDHRRVPQPHPVILRAAHPDRVFLEVTQARDSLAGIEQHGLGLTHGLDISPRHRGDAREVLDGVERAALRRQHGAGVAGEAHQVRAGPDLFAFARENFDSDAGIELAEEGGGYDQAGDRDRIAAVHHAGKARIRWNDALGSNIMPSARQADAEVLGQGGYDKGVKVEAGEGEGGHEPSNANNLRSSRAMGFTALRPTLGFSETNVEH